MSALDAVRYGRSERLYRARTSLSVTARVLTRYRSRLAADWPKQLQKLLPVSRPFLDAAIDSGGGPLGTQLIRLLRDGAIIACYGQTTMQPLDMPMALVLKNVEIRGKFPSMRVAAAKSTWADPLSSLRSLSLCDVVLCISSGSTMGSREEFFSAVRLIGEKKIQPVVDSVLNGLGDAEKGFQLLKEGGQFGKVRLDLSRARHDSPVAGDASLQADSAAAAALDDRSQVAIQIANDEKSKM